MREQDVGDALLQYNSAAISPPECVKSKLDHLDPICIHSVGRGAAQREAAGGAETEPVPRLGECEKVSRRSQLAALIAANRRGRLRHQRAACCSPFTACPLHTTTLKRRIALAALLPPAPNAAPSPPRSFMDWKRKQQYMYHGGLRKLTDIVEMDSEEARTRTSRDTHGAGALPLHSQTDLAASGVFDWPSAPLPPTQDIAEDSGRRSISQTV